MFFVIEGKYMHVSIVLALLGKGNNKRMKLIIFFILFNLGRGKIFKIRNSNPIIKVSSYTLCTLSIFVLYD